MDLQRRVAFARPTYEMFADNVVRTAEEMRLADEAGNTLLSLQAGCAHLTFRLGLGEITPDELAAGIERHERVARSLRHRGQMWHSHALQALHALMEGRWQDGEAHAVQADAFGIPVAQVLRVQSAEMRVKRRQRAEEKAQQVPVKITIPLIFCILPTLFIAVMGPAVLSIMDSFNK